MLEGTKERLVVEDLLMGGMVSPEKAKMLVDALISAALFEERVANHLDEMGTSSLHEVLVTAVRELPIDHRVCIIWERLDELLREGGANCLPAPWTL